MATIRALGHGQRMQFHARGHFLNVPAAQRPVGSRLSGQLRHLMKVNRIGIDFALGPSLTMFACSSKESSSMSATLIPSEVCEELFALRLAAR
jgi:hypothetical protein